MWEDPDNVKGGRWLMVVERTKRAERLDVCWLELMLALLGEQFDDYGAEICGAAVNVRQKGDKVTGAFNSSNSHTTFRWLCGLAIAARTMSTFLSVVSCVRSF